MAITKDISIGKGKWIRWIDFNIVNDDFFSIDALLEPNWDFWMLLEIHCISGCCGIDAFSFWPEDICAALKKVDKEALHKNLLTLKTEITNSSKSIIISTKLNNLFDKSVFIQLLDHILDLVNLSH